MVLIFFFLLFYYSYEHTNIRLGSFLPLAPNPSLTTHSTLSLSPQPLNTQQNYFALISNFVEERV
jgi:hypothetical protein